MKHHSVVCWSLILGIPLCCPPVSAAVDKSPQASRTVWDLGVLAGAKSYPTAISATNTSCKGRHDLEITIKDAAWLRLTGEARLSGIAQGETKSTAALVDLRGLAPGSYSGLVTIRCLSCPPPPKCRQDVSELEVRVVVAGNPQPANPFAAIATVGRDVTAYRLIGELHNQLLDELVARQDFPIASRDFVYSEFRGRLSAALGSDIQLPSVEQFREMVARYGGSTIKETAARLAADGQIDDKAREYCEELDNLVASATTAATLSRALDPFDQRVMSDQSLAPREKLIVLGASSTARSSSSYWESALADPTSPWQGGAQKQKVEPGDEKGGGGFFRWVIKAMADVIGFLVGGAIGDVLAPDPRRSGLKVPGVDLTVNAGVGVVVGASLSGTL